MIIGGASFRGGAGRLRDTPVGVLFLAVLNNGLQGLQMGDAQFLLIKGIAILGALTLRALAFAAKGFSAAGDLRRAIGAIPTPGSSAMKIKRLETLPRQCRPAQLSVRPPDHRHRA